MDKIWNFIRKFNYIQLMLIVVTIRAVVFGTTIADALILIPIAALIAFNKWVGDLENKKVNDYILAELQEMKARMAGISTLSKQSSKNNKPIDKFWG